MNQRAIVIGAGHNGLVAALELAAKRHEVVVLEARDGVGGLCAPREFAPGYTAPGIHHETATLRREIAETHGLDQHGLRFRDDDVPVFTPTQKKKGILLPRDPEQARAELSKSDGEAYSRWRGFLSRISPFIRSVLDAPPPQPNVSSLAALWDLAKQGLALRRLGERDMLELMRIAPMCAADWLEEMFESPPLCELLAGSAVFGTFAGPWSPGTAIHLLLQECARDREVHGGPAALVRALHGACRARGVTIRTGARVARIAIDESGAARGVELASGEMLDARFVLASCAPSHALLDLLPPGSLSLRGEEQLRAVRVRGAVAKVHLALDGPLEFAGRKQSIERARIGGGELDALERAFDAAKYRSMSEQPFLDVHVPTLDDPSLAPDGSGHHVVSILASFAPHDLEPGWSDTQRDAFADRVVARLATAAPKVRDRIVAREVLSPRDLEIEYGLPGGHIHHGEHALDQLLFMRPTPGCARYETEIRGLFLGGSGSHPGGGVTGMPGALGARAVRRT